MKAANWLTVLRADNGKIALIHSVDGTETTAEWKLTPFWKTVRTGKRTAAELRLALISEPSLPSSTACTLRIPFPVTALASRNTHSICKLKTAGFHAIAPVVTPSFPFAFHPQPGPVSSPLADVLPHAARRRLSIFMNLSRRHLNGDLILIRARISHRYGPVVRSTNLHIMNIRGRRKQAADDFRARADVSSYGDADGFKLIRLILGTGVDASADALSPTSSSCSFSHRLPPSTIWYFLRGCSPLIPLFFELFPFLDYKIFVCMCVVCFTFWLF